MIRIHLTGEVTSTQASMSEKSNSNSGEESNSNSGLPPSSTAPASGRLKISFRGKVASKDNTSPSAQTHVKNAVESLHANSTNISSTLPKSTSKPIESESSGRGLLNEASAKEKEMYWKAESLLQQILAPKAAAFEFVPSVATEGAMATVKVRGREELALKRPMSQLEALLMSAALKVLGKVDYAKILLPSSMAMSLREQEEACGAYKMDEDAHAMNENERKRWKGSF